MEEINGKLNSRLMPLSEFWAWAGARGHDALPVAQQSVRAAVAQLCLEELWKWRGQDSGAFADFADPSQRGSCYFFRSSSSAVSVVSSFEDSPTLTPFHTMCTSVVASYCTGWGREESPIRWQLGNICRQHLHSSHAQGYSFPKHYWLQKLMPGNFSYTGVASLFTCLCFHTELQPAESCFWLTQGFGDC